MCLSTNIVIILFKMTDESESDLSLYYFKDTLNDPDIIHNYGKQFSGLPIIIDNGM